MTQAAQTLAAMEAAWTSPQTQQQIQSQHPSDWIFREVLSLTFDPFVHNDWPSAEPLPPFPVGVEALARIDDALESGVWLQFSAQVRSFVGYELLRFDWESSVAWPLLARVLAKRFDRVASETVFGVWGNPRKFVAAPIGQGGLTYPRYAIPEVGPRTILTVKSTPYSARVDLYSLEGEHKNAEFEPLAVELASLFSRCYRPDGVFASFEFFDMVFDGFIETSRNPARDTFVAFDVVPSLSDFAAQRLRYGEWYVVRLNLLRRIRDKVCLDDYAHLYWPFDVANVRYATSENAMKKIANDWRGTYTLGAFGIDPESAYPYTADCSYQRIV